MKFVELVEDDLSTVTPEDTSYELHTQYWSALHESERLIKLLPKVNPNLRANLRLQILSLLDERTSLMAQAREQFSWFDA